MNGRAKGGAEPAVAAVLGGAVTRERLKTAAAQEGHVATPLVRSLLAQSLPAIDDLARAYGSGVLRIDESFLKLSQKAARLLDPALLRRECCVPVEILHNLCILAVTPGRAQGAVTAVRAALQRDVLPVLADLRAVENVLDGLEAAPKACRLGPLPRRDSPVHARFRQIVLSDEVLDAIATEERA